MDDIFKRMDSWWAKLMEEEEIVKTYNFRTLCEHLEESFRGGYRGYLAVDVWALTQKEIPIQGIMGLLAMFHSDEEITQNIILAQLEGMIRKHEGIREDA